MVATAVLVLMGGLLARSALTDTQGLEVAPAATALTECLTRAEQRECVTRVMRQIPAERVSDVVATSAGAVLANTEVDCHSVLHVFGESAAAAHGRAALVPGGSACSGGYYHGVLAALGHAGEELLACDILVGEDRLACWHGAGHMAVLNEDFSPGWASEQCRTASDEQAVDLCVQGIAMEFVGLRMPHESPEQVLSATLELCSQLPSVGSAGCARQAFNQVGTEAPLLVADACTDATGEVAATCWDALGAAIGGGYLPAEQAADMALGLCDGRQECLMRAIEASNDSRPAVGIAQDICRAEASLASCRRP